MKDNPMPRGRPRRRSDPPPNLGNYRIVDKETGKVLYDGTAYRLAKRKAQHKQSSKYDPEKHHFDYQVAKPGSSQQSVRAHEKAKIQQHNPPWNRNVGGGGRLAQDAMPSNLSMPQQGNRGFQMSKAKDKALEAAAIAVVGLAVEGGVKGIKFVSSKVSEKRETNKQIGYLIECFVNGDTNADIALINAGPIAVKPLMNLWKNVESSIRIKIAVILGEIGDPRGLKLLNKEKKEPSESVKQAMREARAKILEMQAGTSAED